MAKSNHLKKELRVLDLFCISSGAMISSGLFILPAIVFRKTGPTIIIAYLIAAIFVIPAMLCKAELTTAMPKSGGAYFFIHRSLGPLMGTFAGLASWFSLSLKSAFALVGMGVFIELIFPFSSPIIVKSVAIGFTLFFTLLNIISIKESSKFQIILVSILILILSLYIFLNLEHINVSHYIPQEPFQWSPIFTAAGMIFVSYGGLTKLSSIAEEARNPGKDVPRGMFSSFVVVSLIYALTVFVTIGLLNKGEFDASLTPLSTGAGKHFGRTGFIILAIAAMTAFVTTANAGLMASSRIPLAMAKDHLLPFFFSKVNLKFKTPIVSILITSVFMISVIVFLNIEQLVKVASTMKLLLFMFVSISLIIMRESKITSYRPEFKIPLYPILPIAGVIIYGFLIFGMGKIPLILTSVFFIISLAWYFLYSKSRNNKESALIHIVERMTNKAIKSSRLTNELREILIERDQIIEDRFDHIIKNASLIEIEEQINADELFKILAADFSKRLGLDQASIYDLLIKRENESTTAISKGLAIPHIVLEGEVNFDIIVLRAVKGIIFDQDQSPVHIVFALAGSNRERTFHLQALMAIAQIVQNKDFIKKWLKAHDKNEMKNLILLAERVRKGDI